MEIVELIENVYSNKQLLNYNYIGSTLYGSLSPCAIEQVYELLVRNKLTYDPTKLNPLSGTYGFLTTFLTNDKNMVEIE